MNRKQRRAAEQGGGTTKVGAAESLNKRGLSLVGRDIALAADLFRQASTLKPAYAEAHNNLGAALHSLGRYEEAEEACRKALALKPKYASALYNRGLVLKAMGRIEDALAAYRSALAIRPDDSDTHCNLGVALDALRRHAEAAAAFRAALAIAPDNAEAQNNLGVQLVALGDVDQGIDACQRALTLKPDYPEALGNLSTAFFGKGRFDDAASMARKALALQPTFADGHNNLGVALQASNQLPEAISHYRKAIDFRADSPEAHYNLATSLLQNGENREGWREYEWRLKGGIPALKPRICGKPQWNGEEIAGRTLLLHGEQGLGDVLQFARYATLAASRGARVILEVYPSLKRLLSSVPGVAQVVATTEPSPYFDFHLPLLSAPHLLAPPNDGIPAMVPYVVPADTSVAVWKRRLDDLPGLKVGLAWSGNLRQDRRAQHVDRRRNLSLSQLAPLLAIPGISFISLQKGVPAQQSEDLPRKMGLIDLMDDVADFADTAALVANLDLVISVDTSVAHLAGATGKPVWILSRFDGCWRWLTDRDDSPWYPTAQLFRQKTPGGWSEVLDRVAAELEKIRKSSGAGVSPAFRRSRKPGISAAVRVGGGQDVRPTHHFYTTRLRGDDEPDDNSPLFADAMTHHQAGRLAEAKDLYLRILDADPSHFDSLHHLGLIALWSNDPQGAVQWISKAIALNRSHVGAHINLGKALDQMGRLDDAVIVFRMAVELDPEDADARYLLGVALHDLERWDDASAAYRDALVLKPDFALALANLGGALGEKGRHDEAITICERALSIDPRQSRARSILGTSLHGLHRIDEAIGCYRQAIALNPELPETHHNLATALLLKGRYEEGWREYEWRWKGAIPDLKPRSFGLPRWQGEPLSGRTILLHGEQGLGDVLQFSRYASLLAAHGARVILEVYPPLTRLLATVPGVARTLATGEALPDFDYHLPLLSAPLLLDTGIDTIPAQVPYVTPDSSAVSIWRDRVAHLPGLKIGLVWAGDPRTHNLRNNEIDRRRSLSLDRLKPLLTVAGISWVSLQKGKAALQIQQNGLTAQFFDVMAEMKDFADTAALVANLDLVIAVDTSVAHLAGALGKPVWILNRFNGCWRWLEDRDDSPWYPTARLFRQSTAGNWDEVIEQVTALLAIMAEKGNVVGPTVEELFGAAVRHHQENRLKEADVLYRGILVREPQHPVILHHCGVIAQQMENPAAAVAFIRQALCIRPAYMEAWTNLGTALRDLGQRAQAEPCLRRAIRLQPEIAEAHNNLGSLCTELRRLDDAIASFRAALALQPGNPEIHCNLGAALLERGDYAEGWREHEWRLHPEVSWKKAEPVAQPRWTGETLKDRTILLRSEQGLGDDLQFARFVTPIAALGAKVILEAPASLTRLLRSVPGVAQVLAKGEIPPDFDYYLSSMSAPHLLGTTLDTIPAEIPYVTPDAAEVAAWRARLAHLPGVKVGLVWAGDPRPYDRRANAIDRRRSISLCTLAPLLALPGLSFISLQKGEAAKQIDDLAAHLRPFDMMDEISDFADTAALVANLDLVISVDTSVVHLAGAMGKPVWILSRYDGCWRWLANREDSPWYPSARLFRQSEPGNWEDVAGRVATALDAFAVRVGGGQDARPTHQFFHEENLLPLAMEHHRAGRLADADSLYRRILAVDPDHVIALHHLGLIARQSGDFATVERLIGRAVALAPDNAQALCNLGAALNDQGKARQAMLCAERAVILLPNYAKAHNNLGKAFKDLGKATEAATSYRRAAIIDPCFVMAFTNLSAALQDLGQFAEALACCEQALTLEPDSPIAHNNRGVILAQQGDSDGAIRHYTRAARLAPDYAEMRVNLGMALLLSGNFSDGWRDYEWRWNGGMQILRKRNFSQPRWAGEDLSGRTILLHAEQGLGDALQFARYATLFARRGARVVLEVHPPLKRLLASVSGVSQVLTTGEVFPAFDCHLPLMSAPHLLGTTLETIPAETPYVTPDAEQTRAWRDRLAALPGLKVGLVWAGNPRAFDPDANLIDQRRSMTLAQMEPLLKIGDVSFISLQKDAPASQFETLSADLQPTDWMEQMGDLADTAALVANLDLVISVDTSVVHLAGALGIPVWILSRFDGCWRWLKDRDDSPWYPTARLFRQKTPGDWDEVVARVAEELKGMASSPRHSRERACERIRKSSGAGVSPVSRRGRKPSVSAAVSVGGGQDARPTHQFLHTLESGNPVDGMDPRLRGDDEEKRQININAQLFSQAVEHHQAGRLSEARSLYLRMLSHGPDVSGHAEASCNLGILFRQQGKMDTAVSHFHQALQLRPDYADALNNLGLTFNDQGESSSAVACYLRALSVQPGNPLVQSNLGVALQGLGRSIEAVAAYRQAIALQPNQAGTHYNLALALLLLGDFEEGWREHEWLWRGGAEGVLPRHFSQPRWEGSSLDGKTILLYAEQGLGDTLQFSRYATLIAALGGRVLLEAHPPLKRLLKTVPGVAHCLEIGEVLPHFDCYLPLMGAPFQLGTRVESIPANVPYVTADSVLATQWETRLRNLPGLKVGLVWAGDPRPGDLRAHIIDGRRSIGLTDWLPILSMSGISFVSLQKGSASIQIRDLPIALRPSDWMEEIIDFADTAALVTNLDLVISVDTSVAHLAGAIGKPVWILSRFDGCWRWLTDRDESPWYPTARLFRQKTPGDWREAIDRVAAELAQFAGSLSLPSLPGLTRQSMDPRVKPGDDEKKRRLPENALLFSQAVEHHKAGRLDEAKTLYERILRAEPDNVGCLFHLGLVAQQQGQHADAVAHLKRAAERNDQIAGLHDALGTSFLALGHIVEAIAAHGRALTIKPDFFEAAYNLGNAFQSLGDQRRAAACFRRTIIQCPDLAEPYNNLGNLLSADKNFDEAWHCYRRAIAIHPHYAAAHNNLGNVLKEKDRLGEAALCFERALHLQTDYVEAHYNLGNTLLEASMVDASIAAFRRAVVSRPDLTEAYNNLGSALYMQEQGEEAVVCFDRALRLDPRFPETHCNLGAVFRDRGELDQACAANRQAIACDPDYALAHSNLGVTLLLKGDFAQGFREFEWRRPHRQAMRPPRSNLPPRWTGEDPTGRTILLQAEQGLGDVLQFARYATEIVALGAQVILEVYPPLKRLLASVPGIAQLLTPDDALPDGVDWHLPMMSAPYVLGTRLETIPATVPYVSPDAKMKAAWERRLAKLPGLKVGLVWAGDPRRHDPRAHAIDRRRSIALDRLTPLLMVPDVHFVSLQKGVPSAQIGKIAAELQPLDLMEEVADFADSAALVANLDLVISVDTSVVHLAGALGKPVWILSRFDGCWRWLTGRDDSPWYPTARLFRQTAPGNWDEVIVRVARELAEFQRKKTDAG